MQKKVSDCIGYPRWGMASRDRPWRHSHTARGRWVPASPHAGARKSSRGRINCLCPFGWWGRGALSV